MTKLNRILIGLTAVQLALALFVLLRSDSSKAEKPQPILAGFDAAQVTRVQVFEAGSDKGVDLVKQGATWVLASQWNYPADTARVEHALTPLAKLVAGDPIATSPTKHKQLRVGDKDFDKKVVITAGGKDTTMFLGTIKGRNTALRFAGDDRVLSVAGVPSIAGNAREWVMPSYVDIPRDDIDKIEITRGTTKLELDRSGPAASGSGSAAPERTWRVAIDGAPLALATGETFDNMGVETIVSAMTNLNAEPADPKRDASAPTATVTVTKRDGKSLVFDLVDTGAFAWVKQRGLDRATSVDKARVESILTYVRANFIAKPAAKGIPGMPPGAPIVPPPDGIE